MEASSSPVINDRTLLPLANVASSAIEARPKATGNCLMNDLAELLESPTITSQECRMLLRNLQIFAFQMPKIRRTKNLFKADQTTGVKSYNLNSDDQIKHRNWQFILRQSSNQCSDSSLMETVWRKSRAVEIGRMMASSSTGRNTAGHEVLRLIVSFWLQRLFQAQGINTAKLPSCVKIGYEEFLQWRGEAWKERTISFEVLKQNVFEISEQQRQLSIMKENSQAEARQEEIQRFCHGVGTKGLRLYMSQGYNCTLEEFKEKEWVKKVPILVINLKKRMHNADDNDDDDEPPVKKQKTTRSRQISTPLRYLTE